MVVACRRHECDAGPEREHKTCFAKARCRQPSFNLRFLQVAICLLSIITFGAFAQAQKVGGTGGSGGGGTAAGSGTGTSSRGGPPPSNTNSGVYNSGMTNSSPNQPNGLDWDTNIPNWMGGLEKSGPTYDPVLKDESCLRWTVDGVQGATVSAARLGVPKDARKDFEGACSALRNKRLPEAEKQVRKAIGEDPNFVTAWVMLGQILGEQQQRPEAREACSHALSSDANYVPAYLCLADITYSEGNWDSVLDYSTRALSLDPVHDAYGYFYSAAAFYNKGKLGRAENNASRAAEIDKQHREPEVVFLLAKIHQAQGDLSAAIAELHEYLKLAPASMNSELAKKDLSDLDGSIKR
jgi:cytochrome c-type biogenesis protein CcmH/NrfG